jgi:hypothetical protein
VIIYLDLVIVYAHDWAKNAVPGPA